MPQQVDNLQIPKRNILPALYIDARVRKVRRSRVRRWRSRVRRWRSLTDQGEVLDDYCHMTSASGTLRSEGHIITF